MERWYIAFNTFGSPLDILRRLSQAVREHRLGDFVIRFCYEKGADKKRGQFYVFVGVSSEQKGIIPPELQNEFYTMLQRLRLSDQKLYVYFDDVKRMVTKELEIHNLRQIKMLKQTRLSPSDPFDFLHEKKEEQPDQTQRQAYNNLMNWLSAYGRGSWQQFRTACNALRLDPTGEHSRRIMRRLRSLGHVELTRDGQNWLVAPPALVCTESDTSQYCTFLAGQRSSILLQELQNTARVEIEPQPYGDSPDIVRATFANRKDAENFARNFSQQHHSLHLAGIAALEIASRLPDLKTWGEQLPSVSIVKGNYNYEQWLDGTFCPVHLPKETGLYRLTHVSTRFEHPRMTFFYDAERDIWRKGDWYGLHYLMLKRTGESCEFYFDHNLSKLGIALDNRLPDMYERSLVLASGKLPLFWDWQVVFGNVSETLAHILANKLEAGFIEHRGI